MAVSEVGSHELWQKAEIGIASVGPDRAYVNSVIDKVVDYIESLHVAEIADYDVEIINY